MTEQAESEETRVALLERLVGLRGGDLRVREDYAHLSARVLRDSIAAIEDGRDQRAWIAQRRLERRRGRPAA